MTVEIEGRLEGIQPYAIHGTRYFRVFFSHADAPDAILQAQLPFDAIDDGIRPGDPITVSYLLKTVVRISKQPS